MEGESKTLLRHYNVGFLDGGTVSTSQVCSVLTLSDTSWSQSKFFPFKQIKGGLGFSVSDNAKALRHLWAASKALAEQDVSHNRNHLTNGSRDCVVPACVSVD